MGNVPDRANTPMGPGKGAPSPGSRQTPRDVPVSPFWCQLHSERPCWVCSKSLAELLAEWREWQQEP